MAAVFEEDSTDDEIGVNLQLAERLRINRVDQNSSDRKFENSKDFKQYCNMRRKKQHSRDGRSSSSSSLDMHNDACASGITSPFVHPNKKRQNGDKNMEQFANPKRTCLSDRFRKASEWRDYRKKGHNGDIRFPCTRMPDSLYQYSESSSAKRNLFPDKTYEDHINNLADAEDSDVEIKTQHPYRNFQKGVSQNSRTSKNNPSSSKSSVLPESYENQASASRSIHFIESGSDDDSKTTVQNGALKGGRQSPDLIYFQKKVLGRKMKKVLDSDDSDDEAWQAGYRSRPLVFSSSDSEDSKQTNVKTNASDGIANGSANHSFSFGDTYQHNDHHTSKQYKISQIGRYNRRSPNKTSYRSSPPVKPQVFNRDGCKSEFQSSATSDIQGKSSHNKTCRARRSPRINMPSTSVPSDSFVSNSGTSSASHRGRNNMNGAERCARRSGSPHPRTMQGQRRAESTKCSGGRSLSSSHSRQEKLDLAAAYPDIFDAENSSEVEFFTANSYSDTETESLGGLTINATFVSRPDTMNSTEIVCEHSVNVGSSEDEISVVFSTAPHVRNTEQRRGTSRALGRRYGRGSARRHLQNTEEVVSLSPDPVEQVRQVEEDERYARMLQAQYDAEVDHDYTPPGRTNSPATLFERSAESDDDIIDPVGDSDSEGVFQSAVFPYVHAVVPISRRGFRMHRFSTRPGTPNVIPPNIFITNRRMESRNRRWRLGNEQRQFARLFGLTPNTMAAGFLPFDNIDDDYETFLGLAELNGDVVPRGLERAQINRLPTRKYINPNAAASCHSSEMTHKRADLNKECQVCLSDYETGDVLRILPCFHEFHTPCIDPWLKINHTCPVCRVIVDLEE